jgi:hypothetical protein
MALSLVPFSIVFALGTSLPISSSSSNSSRSNSSSRLANSRASTRANSSHSRVMHQGGPGWNQTFSKTKNFKKKEKCSQNMRSKSGNSKINLVIFVTFRGRYDRKVIYYKRMLHGGNAQVFNYAYSIRGSHFSYMTLIFLFLISECFAKPRFKNYHCFTLYIKVRCSCKIPTGKHRLRRWSRVPSKKMTKCVSQSFFPRGRWWRGSWPDQHGAFRRGIRSNMKEKYCSVFCNICSSLIWGKTIKYGSLWISGI